MSVYFIREPAAGRIKIGHTKDVLKRLVELQTGHPSDLSILGVMAGDAPTERALHTQFRSAHVRGEWFDPAPALLAFIASNAVPFLRPSKPKPPIGTFPGIIAGWPSTDLLADDLGVKKAAVILWRHRKSIPPQYWARLVKSAQARGLSEVTLDLLSELAARGAKGGSGGAEEASPPKEAAA